MRYAKMCERILSAKVVYLLALVCYSTFASPLSAAVVAKLSQNDTVASGFGRYKFEDNTEKSVLNIEGKAGDSSAKILKYTNDNDGLGSYKFEYKTGNGIYQAEEGKLKQVEKEEAIAVSGNYEYLAPNGQKISVVYVADESGYRPKVYITTLLSSPPSVGAPPALLASLVGR